MTTAPEAVRPVYRTSEPNSEIVLFAGEIEIEQVGVRRTFNGSVALQFSRYPLISVDIDRVVGDTDSPLDLAPATMKFDRMSDPIQVGVLISRQVRDVDGMHHVHTARTLEPIRVGPVSPVAKVIAHLANFDDYIGDSIGDYSDNHRRFWRGRIALADPIWTVRTDSILDGSIQHSLKTIGGYAITHAISIERSDGKLFVPDKKFEKLLRDLGRFLSFIRGFQTEPFLFVGLDSSDTRIWEEWSPPRLDRFQVVDSWFRDLPVKALETFWPNFRSSMEDSKWGPVFHRSLKWYLTANKGEGGIDGAIVLAQTVHELLSWTRFVTEERLSESGFKDLPAADKIRLLLAQAAVSSAIPKQFRELSRAVKKGRRIDGPEAVTIIRNAIVHPKKNDLDIHTLDDDAIYQAWTLSMWYLDLGLLYLLGYQDKYTNRTVIPKWRGEFEEVPWR